MTRDFTEPPTKERETKKERTKLQYKERQNETERERERRRERELSKYIRYIVRHSVFFSLNSPLLFLSFLAPILYLPVLFSSAPVFFYSSIILPTPFLSSPPGILHLIILQSFMWSLQSLGLCNSPPLFSDLFFFLSLSPLLSSPPLLSSTPYVPL